MTWRAHVLTLHPEVFPGPLAASVLGRALSASIWSLDTVDLRTFGVGRHRQVDDRPAGGGAGMVMRADVVGAAMEAALADAPADAARVVMSARGQRFQQADAETLAKASGVILLCGRFEGIDQRVIDHYALRELSVGDAVVTGGEVPAMAVLEASVRLLPGVLGAAASLSEESFGSGMLEYPQFTRPRGFAGREIPSVLTSGDHAAIARWRADEARAVTERHRPDLLSQLEREKPDTKKNETNRKDDA